MIFVFYSEIVGGKLEESTEEHPKISFFDWDKIKEMDEEDKFRAPWIVKSIEKYRDNFSLGLELLDYFKV